VRTSPETDGNIRFLVPVAQHAISDDARNASRRRTAKTWTQRYSYPGAAQDILGIPRKGSSLEELKWGLNRAGIAGSYLKERVTHDEVDAITSAFVGLFYLADDYIALGTPKEDYLIVPRSPKINYLKLSEILSRTGLDELAPAQFVAMPSEPNSVKSEPSPVFTH